MREYKFRGKARMNYEDLNDMGIPNKNGWVTGNLAGDVIVGEIVELDEDYVNFEWWVAVYKNTIGQYTGLKDKNGRKIYQGDILRVSFYKPNRKDGPVIWSEYLEVAYYKELAQFVTLDKDSLDNYIFPDRSEVVGNIYENPELLEVK